MADTFASAPAVVLAPADTYPDALAGAPLAAKRGGPMLLTDSQSMSEPARAEITRFGAGRVVLLGDDAAPSAQAHNDLIAMGVGVDRIVGGDRFDMARRIAVVVGATRSTSPRTQARIPSAGGRMRLPCRP